RGGLRAVPRRLLGLADHAHGQRPGAQGASAGDEGEDRRHDARRERRDDAGRDPHDPDSERCPPVVHSVPRTVGNLRSSSICPWHGSYFDACPDEVKLSGRIPPYRGTGRARVERRATASAPVGRRASKRSTAGPGRMVTASGRCGGHEGCQRLGSTGGDALEGESGSSAPCAPAVLAGGGESTGSSSIGPWRRNLSATPGPC